MRDPNNIFDVIIIGGGVVGLSIAYYLTQKRRKVLLIEKNKNVGLGNSNLNSSVVHAGIYYKKNSLKSKFSLEGRKLLKIFCKKNRIRYKEIGKLFISDSKNITNLKKIFRQGKINKLKNLKIINSTKLSKFEPKINSQFALYSPSSSIFDVRKFISVLKKKSLSNNLIIRTNMLFLKRKSDKQLFIFKKNSKKNKKLLIFKSKYIVNCSGIESVKIAKKLNKNLKLPKTNLVLGAYLYYPIRIFKHIIYQTFEPGKIIERVDATPHINKGTIFGPSVEKGKNNVKWSKLKKRFFNSIKLYYPQIKFKLLSKYKFGLRPKIYYENKNEVNDFYIKKSHNVINLLGIESPGLTSCLSIGKYVNKLIKLNEKNTI